MAHLDAEIRAVVMAALAVIVVGAPALAEPNAEAAPPAARPLSPRERFHLHVMGSLPTAAWDLSDARTFREFAEDGHLRTQYAADGKLGYEAGAQYDVLARWGLAAAVSGNNRDVRASYEADLPHPLYLRRDREVSGELPGLAYKETLAHFDLVHTIPTSRIDVSLFAGTSRASVSSELIRTVEYRHEYPYDVVTVTGTPTQTVKGTVFGFNVGGALSWKLRPHVALSAQGRYTKAKVKLVPVANQTLDVDAGGLAAALGVRLGF